MKIKKPENKYSNPNVGDTRIIKRFVLFATTEEDDYFVVFEKVKILQKYGIAGYELELGYILPDYGWINVRFIEE